MRDYELVCILDPGMEDAQIQETIRKMSGVIESNSGVVENVRTSEVRRLAFSLKKRTEGIYVVINFKSESSFIQELDRVLKLDDRILRHRAMVSTLPPPLPQVPASSRTEAAAVPEAAAPEATSEVEASATQSDSEPATRVETVEA